MVLAENFPGEKKEDEGRLTPLQIAVLISNKGTGTNLQAIIDAIDRREINCNIGVVISDKPDALGLERTKKHNILSEVLPYGAKEITKETYGRNLGEFLNKNGVQIAVLAGFSTILPCSYFETFNGTTINIHPGLIPDKEDEIWRFPDGTEAPWNRGLMTDDAVKNFLGLKYAGSTWHIATEATDFGPVLERVIVEVEPNDTVETLYARLKIEEHRGLIKVLKNPPRKS